MLNFLKPKISHTSKYTPVFFLTFFHLSEEGMEHLSFPFLYIFWVILLDDVKCTTLGKEFVITEGEHKIKFTIGDYEIVRSISAIKGKTYTANFSLDLDISEN